MPPDYEDLLHLQFIDIEIFTLEILKNVHL